MNDESIKEDKNIDFEEYKCPSCNADLVYNPTDSTLVCEFCGYTEKVIGEESDVEYDFDDINVSEEDWSHETKIMRCDNCGAESVVSVTEICHKCAFCGSNQITQTNELPGIKPHRVVSFKINKEEAENAYKQKIKKCIFTPNAVKKMKISLVSTGVYLPVWTFDTNTESHYSGRLGKTYTRKVGSGKNARYVTSVRWFRISGIENVVFDDELVNAGKKINANEMKRLEPFDTNHSFVYDKKYLASFVAEHYTLKVKDAFNIAKNRMKSIIEKEILSNYIYDRYGYLNVSTSYNDLKYKYVLIPVWIGVFTYKNKKYRYLVNGTNSKRIVAKLPLSGLKITLFIFGIIFIIMLIILSLYFL